MGRDEVRRGQIAHINQDRSDNALENLAYLCFEHHDEFDSKTSQSKALTSGEVRHFRARLHQHFVEVDTAFAPTAEPDTAPDETAELPDLPPITVYEQVRKNDAHLEGLLTRPWRFATLGVTANQPEYFAYRAWNHCDGVCLIERIDLPDGRIVVACIETEGNPGQSITNAVEELAFQVCESLDIPPAKLVWLEHYDITFPSQKLRHEWSWVRFETMPPDGPFTGPEWIEMTEAEWRSLRLKPRRRLRSDYTGWQFESKLKKLFPWP